MERGQFSWIADSHDSSWMISWNVEMLHLRIKSSRYLGLSALLRGCQEGFFPSEADRCQEEPLELTLSPRYVPRGRSMWVQVVVYGLNWTWQRAKRKVGSPGSVFFRGNREGRLWCWPLASLIFFGWRWLTWQWLKIGVPTWTTLFFWDHF